MSLFQISFWSVLRTQLTSWRTWGLMLLLPLLMFGAARILPAEEVSTPVQVGVVLPQEGGEAFWQRIEARGGLVVTFHRAEYGRAERQVAAGQWDCALVLPQDFEQRLTHRDTYRLFTMLVGPGSTVYPMVRETASACVAELISPGMAEDYLLDSGIVMEDQVEAVRPRLSEALLDQDRVLVTMETADGRPLDSLTLADSGVSNLLSGLTAILLLIWTLLTAMDLGRWLDTPFARRLIPLQGAFPLLLPRLSAALIPALCSGALALLAVENGAACILALVSYLLLCGALALALARWRSGWGTLPVLLPFVPVLGLFLSPILLDVSMLYPFLAPVIRWMPITLYLRACDGVCADGLMLAASGIGILILFGLLDRKNA